MDLRKIFEWFLRARVLMVEIASSISFGMLLGWLLWKEYQRLFRHKRCPLLGSFDITCIHVMRSITHRCNYLTRQGVQQGEQFNGHFPQSHNRLVIFDEPSGQSLLIQGVVIRLSDRTLLGSFARHFFGRRTPLPRIKSSLPAARPVALYDRVNGTRRKLL